MNNLELRNAAQKFAANIPSERMTNGFQEFSLYEYQDIQGLPIYWRIRLKNPVNGEKFIRPFYFDAKKQGFFFSEPKFLAGKPLYNLPQLVTNRDSTIYVVEGENKVEALKELGFVATTSGSASSAAKADWEILRERKIIIWRDNDAAGLSYAKEVTETLRELGCIIQWIDIDKLGLPESGDCIDWLLTKEQQDQETLKAEISSLPVKDVLISEEQIRDESLGLVVTSLSSIQPEEISWLWPGFIALGKLSLIAGDPGLGKSFITLDIAARVTTGKPWPVDGGLPPTGDVILLSCEDDPADTIRPRLDAAGANVKRIHHISMIREKNHDGSEIESRAFSLKRDINELGKCLEKFPDCKLVVIDPITAYSDGVDTHKNADVRSLLAPLADLARRYKVAILCVTHLSKSNQANVLNRVSGSVAFGAAARFVFAVTKDQNDSSRRLVLQAKNNLGKDSKGLAYSLREVEQTAIVEWENQYLTISAEEAFSGIKNEKTSAKEDAMAWLQETLANGVLQATEILSLAKAEGFSEATLRRAKKEMNISVRKLGFSKDSKFYWELPMMIKESNDDQPSY
jgi:putative DNA primase/helicase